VRLSTKYFIPLLASLVRLNSQANSKSPYFSRVIMSPPFPFKTKAPSSITQPSEGKLSLRTDRHWLRFSPSNNISQSAGFSSTELLGGPSSTMFFRSDVLLSLLQEITRASSSRVEK